MKKIYLFIMSLALIIGFTGCVSTETNLKNEKRLEGILESILEKIYETANLSDDMKEFLAGPMETNIVTNENCTYYLGSDKLSFKSAIASESLITTQPYSLCLVRTNENDDIEKIKSEIKNNVDPRKWICVGVDEEIIVDNVGDVVILIMSNNDSKALHDAFLKLQ